MTTHLFCKPQVITMTTFRSKFTLSLIQSLATNQVMLQASNQNHSGMPTHIHYQNQQGRSNESCQNMINLFLSIYHSLIHSVVLNHTQHSNSLVLDSTFSLQTIFSLNKIVVFIEISNIKLTRAQYSIKIKMPIITRSTFE